MTTAIPTCDVCAQRPGVGIGSSAFGPCSWSYCAECLSKPAEPRPSFQYIYEDVSDKGEGVADWVLAWFTWENGAYVSWPDYVAARRAAE